MSKIETARGLIEARTKSVSAYALSFEGQMAGKVVLTYPRDGAGVLRCQVLFFAGPLARLPDLYGKAGGYGYDKASAAVREALGAASVKASVEDYARTLFGAFNRTEDEAEFRAECEKASDYLIEKKAHLGAGEGWEAMLRRLGYTAHCVV